VTGGTPFFLTARAPEPSEWSVVGWSQDPVHHGDLERVAEARRRYTGVAETLSSAVTRLDKITAGGEQLQGEYADALRSTIEKVHDGLAKAAVRYEDVAHEVKIYEPALESALTETRAGLADGKAAAASLAAAKAMPDGEPGEDGVLDDAATAADTQKQGKVDSADGALAAAKKRVQTAFDRLQVAGQQLGRNASARRYDDGLTDSGWDKVVAVFKKISKVLAIIGMVLAVLCFVFPGIAALVALAAVVAVAGLVVASVLYAKGEEGLPDLIFAVLGVVLLGGAVIATSITRASVHTARRLGGLKPAKVFPTKPGVTGPPPVPVRVNTGPKPFSQPSEFADNRLTRWLFASRGKPHMAADVGFWRSSVDQAKTAGRMWKDLIAGRPGYAWTDDLQKFGKDWGKSLSGYGQFQNYDAVRLAGHATSMSRHPALRALPWVAWGTGNSLFALGPGLIWTGGRTEWRTWRDQVFDDVGVLGGDS
jgi:hypothetical protein